MKKIILLLTAVFGLFSCEKEKVETIVKETGNEPLTTFSVAALHKLVGVTREAFIQKLEADKVDFQDKGYEIIYTINAPEKAKLPFPKFQIRASVGTAFDLDKVPYETYRGIYEIQIVPVNEADEAVTSNQYKTIFDFFVPLFNAVEPTKKPYSITLEDTDAKPALITKLEDYNEFIKDLTSVDGVIIWNNNPPSTEVVGLFGRKSIILATENSSKEKNTPINELKYYHKQNRWIIKLKFNKPDDWNKNVKK